MLIAHGFLIPKEKVFAIYAEGENGHDECFVPPSVMPLSESSTSYRTFLLPSDGKKSIPSSPMLCRYSSTTAISPSVFTFKTYDFSLIQSLKFLMKCSGKTISYGVAISDDLRWFAHLAAFAALLVAQCRYIPSVEHGAAQWLPIIDADSTNIIDKFSDSQPQSVRAVFHAKEYITLSASSLTKTALELFVDAIVRSSLPVECKNAEHALTLHSMWINSLLTQYPDNSSLSAIEDDVHKWQHALLLRVSSPLNLMIEVIEPTPIKIHNNARRIQFPHPGEYRPEWKLRCSAVFHKANESPMPLQGALVSPIYNEFAFDALARLSRLAPEIAEAVEHDRKIPPNALRTFLDVQAPILISGGFNFIMPKWRNTDCLTLHAVIEPVAGEGQGLGAQVALRWEVTLDDEVINLDELIELAVENTPLVLVNGRSVILSQKNIEKLLLFLRKCPSEMTLSAVYKMYLNSTNSFPMKISTTGWVDELIRRLNKQEEMKELPVPAGFIGKLRPYQIRGYSWLSFMAQHGTGVCLADDMGLGKTVQALAFILSNADNKLPILLVCPTSVIENWRREIACFSPCLSTLIHSGPKRHKNLDFITIASQYNIVITSYALVSRDSYIADIEWQGVLLDEAQNIKNHDVLQSRAVRVLKSGWRLCLTGTPIENYVGDIWPIMDFLNPGFLGTWGEFSKTYVKHAMHPDILDKVRSLTSPFILRRLKTDKKIITDLPDKIYKKEFCSLTDEQIKLYKRVLGDMSGELETAEGIKRHGVVLAILTRLKQICNHPLQYFNAIGENTNTDAEKRSGKLERLTEIVEEMLNGDERMLIFSQYAEMIIILQKHIQERFGEECPIIHGMIPRDERDSVINRFQEDKNAPRFLALTMKTGGVGINLTRASQVVMYDRWWNPAVEEQAIDRVFRIGQKRNVFVHSLVCSMTLEEWIDELIESKKDMANAIVVSGEELLMKMSTAEIKRVLAYGTKSRANANV